MLLRRSLNGAGVIPIVQSESLVWSNMSCSKVWFSSSLVSCVQSKVWFENFDQQDYHPSANSPLLSRCGAAAYGTAFDIDGRPRKGHFDVRAYQR